MKKVAIKDWMPDSRQLTRLVILVGVLLVVAVISFGGYYYYDRYYITQQPKMQQAVRKAEMDVVNNPGDNEKRLDLADLYLANKRFDDALSIVGQVQMDDPNNQRAWLLLGVTYAFKKDPASAVEPLEKYVQANKDSEMPGLNKPLQSAAYYLGDSYLQLNQPDKAVEPLELAVQWSQTDADAMYKLGQAYAGVEEDDKALAVFFYAIKFVPDYREVYEAMAEVLARTDKPELVNYANGMVAYSNKDYKTALELLQKAADSYPDFTPAFTGLGLTYEAQGSLQDAKVAYEKALQITPDDFTASTGKSRVETLLNK